MRKLSLKTYCQYYLRKLSKDSTLSVKKLDQEMETENIRLYVPLLVYCYLKECSVPTTSRLYSELENMRSKNVGDEDEAILAYLESTQGYEHVRFVKSFRAENMRRDESRTKDVCRRIMIQYKEHFHLSYTTISKLVGCDSSNLCAFISRKDNQKLSRTKCDVLVDRLFEVYGEITN